MASSHNLIFFHGWGTDPSVWKNQVEYFSKKYKVETPVICHPEPRRGEGSLRFFGLRPQNDIKEILIGWSYGGMLAIEMAAKEPKKFKALVLVGCSAKFTEGMNPIVIKNILRNLDRNFEVIMRNCYGQFFSNEEAVFMNEFIKQQALPDKGLTIEILDKLAAMDLRAVLKNITIPTLIIHGDKDDICPLKSGVYLRENLRPSRLEIVKGAGHMPFYTRPEEFNRIMGDFIAGVD